MHLSLAPAEIPTYVCARGFDMRSSIARACGIVVILLLVAAPSWGECCKRRFGICVSRQDHCGPYGPGGPPAPQPPPPPTNHNPSVLIVPNGTYCGPTPCSLHVRASASDPDGDPLSYSWSGCTGGSGSEADCAVRSPDFYWATVEVRDGRGGAASDTVAIVGRNTGGPNTPPTVSLSAPVTTCEAPCTITLTANASDADGDPLRYTWSGSAVGGSGRTSTVYLDYQTVQYAGVTVTDATGASASANITLYGTGPTWRRPTDTGNVTAHFGACRGGINQCRPKHNGVDIGVGTGTPVYAAAKGLLSAWGYDGSLKGNYVTIKHADQSYTFYWHLDQIVIPNPFLKRIIGKGELIGYSGATGNVTGPHLHFGHVRGYMFADPLQTIGGYSGASTACGETSCTRDCPCYPIIYPQTSSCSCANLSGVDSSITGGLESKPLWMFDKPDASGSGDTPAERPYWKWANRVGPREEVAQALGVIPAMNVLDLLPNGVIDGTRRVETHPRDVIGNSNASDTLGVDYVDEITGQTRASIAVFKSTGQAYSHDYALCSRFKSSQVQWILPVEIHDETDNENAPNSKYFWDIRLHHDADGDIRSEQATTFVVYVSDDERSFDIDARYLNEDYPKATSGYLLTFQIWAADFDDVWTLAISLFNSLAARGTVHWRNTTPLVAPEVFIATAFYDGENAVLTVNNGAAQPHEVTFDVHAWSAASAQSERRLTVTRTILPGAQRVDLPLPGALNATVEVTYGTAFRDRVFIADGHWFSFDDSGSGHTSRVTSEASGCAEPEGRLSERIVPGCISINGKVVQFGWVGAARGLNPPGRTSVDVTPWRALTFFAQGDGRSYRVGLETDSVARLGSADWHEHVFTATPEGRRITIPFSALAQQGWDAAKLVPFQGGDVRAIVWTTAGDPHDSIALKVDRVAFTRSTIITGTTRLPNTSVTGGPYVVEATVTDDIGVRSTSLVYQTDAGTFRLKMTPDGERVRGEIPGQPNGTSVRYWIETTDSDDNIATDPPDAPVAVYRFQVSTAPYLLVDDFGDRHPRNVLGGDSTLFGHDTGATLTSALDGQTLRLDYDVTRAGSFSGYVTRLGLLDARPYLTVTFLVRASTPGTRLKIGLHDAHGREPKLSVTADTSWRKVAIPLTAFEGLDRASLEGFVIAFENLVASGAGTLWVDDIRFERDIRRRGVRSQSR